MINETFEERINRILLTPKKDLLPEENPLKIIAKEVSSLKENVIAIQKALELMSKAVDLAKTEIIQRKQKSE